jgi:hypothetical protein
MNKKYIRRQIIDDESDEHESSENSQRLLYNINKKLDTSAALNGGFDRLLYKIDGIEQSQSQIVNKVDKIHDAIYDPDDGLFARISANKANHVESISNVEKQIVEINTWKQGLARSEDDCEKETNFMNMKMQDLENSIKNLSKFQNDIYAALKWLGAALGGGIITLLFKLFYSVIMK